jgi:putative N6-adenine-specific DNA methylase
MLPVSNRDQFEIVAKTTYGLEEILAKELAGIGAGDIKILNRAVSYNGDIALLYRSNYLLRTALRILKPIRTRQVANEHELYDAIRSISWNDLLDKNGTLAVDATVKSRFFSHSQYASQKVKDAVVDQFRDRYGVRPSVDLDNPDLRINIHIAEKKLTVSLDSSGESLHKRGYRISMGIAPVSEVLAAGMIILSGWNEKLPFIDLMCGSGTLPIEAAMIANKIPAGYFRKRFGFERWTDFRKDLFKKIQEDYTPVYNPDVIFFGFDIAPEAIQSSRKNATCARLTDYIKFVVSDISNIKKPADKGFIIINPPYGERLIQDDLNVLYKKIGDALKHNFSGYDAWIISSNMEALKNIGLHTNKRITLYNGQLECKFNHFTLYQGSLKNRDTENSNADK